jgi:CDP-diacylglycerol--glycerol-3-phosphate 3-phosphatidyltransferase
MNAPINPHWITAARLPLAPLAVAAMVTDTLWGTLLAAFLAALLEGTDLLDGWMARRYGAVTDFGKLFDPFSDAATRFTLFVGLYAIGAADLWMILAIFYRDSSVSFLRTVSAVRNVVLDARQSGKIKAIVQGIGTQIVFGLLVLGRFFPERPEVKPLIWVTMLIITAVTVWSWVDYFWGNRKMFVAAWFDEPPDAQGQG